MTFVDVIARKRDGHPLTADDIDRFVRGVVDGSVPDYQAAALLMAIVLRGMSAAETGRLTMAMLQSGDRVDLAGLPGVKIGKHSTGGVGDKVSLVFVPLVAACGVVVPKMSGRGLGHTGGTLDKLEAIPGFQVRVDVARFIRMLARTRAAIIGQTDTLVPADRTLYALRDVTATVDSVPLIAASIMSKKLAEGSNALVLDVKCGRGAFMRTPAEAQALARTLVSIGREAGLPTVAFVTRMDAPLGRAVGNAVELVEALDVLAGGGPEDVRDLALTLAARALVLTGGFDQTAADVAVREALSSGAALETFRAMVSQQGGDPRVIDDPGRLPTADTHATVTAPRTGYISRLDADLVGRAAMALGAGRARRDAAIDHGAGILIRRHVGDPVREGEPVLELRCLGGRGLATADALARAAVHVAEAPPASQPLILDIVAGA